MARPFPRPFFRSFLHTALALALGTAVLPAAMAQHAGHAGIMPTAKAGAQPSHGHDMKGAMQAMNDDMARLPMTGDADVDFAKMMRIHHVGAVDMARDYLRKGKDPALRKLAQDIVAVQTTEIAIFDRFLESRGASTGK